jgi:hypothetical protein
MLCLTVLLPALLFGFGTVMLSLREERALASGLGQGGPDGPAAGGSLRDGTWNGALRNLR